MVMDNIFSTFNVSASGLVSQRKRLDFIANNIANINTTRTEAGGPYQPRDLIFSELLSSETDKLSGVNFEEVISTKDPKLVFDPSHPDANEDGYVAYPDINMIDEMVSMMQATRAYEANIQVITSAKAMMARSFEILK